MLPCLASIQQVYVMNRLGRVCFAAVLLVGVLCVSDVAEAKPVKSTVVCIDSVSQVVRVTRSGCVLGREVKQVWPAGVGVPRLCVSKISRDVSMASLSGCAAGSKVLRASSGNRVMLCVDGKSGVLRWPVTGVCNAKNEALWVRIVTKTTVPVIVPVSGTPIAVPVVSLANTTIDSGTWPMAVMVTANVVGTVYFVEGDFVVNTVADITSAPSHRWAQGTIIAANTPTSIAIDVDMLANGYYRVYVASSQGVLSAPAPNKLTISITRQSGAPAEVSTCSVKNASSVSDSSTDFVMTIDTSLTSDDTVSLPLSGVYDVSVNWGDGSRERFVSGDNNEPCHSYSSEGTYTIRISGSLEHFGIDIDDEGPWRGVDIVNTVSNFGSLGIESFSGMFFGAGNLTQVPTVLPVTVTNLSAMFEGASLFDQAIGGWDVGNVTDMSGMFRGASVFNQAIGDWNVGNVTNMSNMFANASAFDQDLSSWEVDQVTAYGSVFANSPMEVQDDHWPDFPMG